MIMMIAPGRKKPVSGGKSADVSAPAEPVWEKNLTGFRAG
jgi:hypothetical protein